MTRVAVHVDAQVAPAAALAVVHRPAAVEVGGDHERLAAHAARHLQAVADVAAGPVVVGRVEHEAAHLPDADPPQRPGHTGGGHPVRRRRLDVDRGVGQPGEHVDAVLQQAEARLAPAAGEALDRAHGVGLEGDDHARAPDPAREGAEPRARAGVLARPAALVAAVARAALVAQGGDQRHLAHPPRAVDVLAHLLARAAVEAAEPAELGLAGDLPDRGRASPSPLPAVGAPCPPGRLPVVHEPLLAQQGIRGKRDLCRAGRDPSTPPAWRPAGRAPLSRGCGGEGEQAQRRKHETADEHRHRHQSRRHADGVGSSGAPRR